MTEPCKKEGALRARPEPHAGVKKIHPYLPGQSRIKGLKSPIKLSSNESPLGPSPKVARALAAKWEMERYPDPSATLLREIIAEKFKIDPDLILAGAGSEQLLGLLAQAYSSPGDEVIHTEYGFLSYPIVAMAAGATPVAAKEKNYVADVNAILSIVTDKTRIVFLANPNNPTGTWISTEEIRRLRAGLPPNVLLVLDVAYAEYMDDPAYSDGVDFVTRAIEEGGDNVALVRTLSKVYGLASFRVGWCYAPKDVIDALHRIRPVFNVTQPAQIAALAALKDTDHIAKAKAHNTEWLPKVKMSLEDLGLLVPSTAGNFVLAVFPSGEEQADAADTFLQKHGIIVRPLKGYALKNALRITIGTKEENIALLEALKIFLK